jgi:hypothetical protein
VDAPDTGELGAGDAEAILAHYPLGRLRAITRLPVRAHNAPYYRVETDSGRYFLKRYRRFTPNADRGLDLAAFLHQRGYPAVEVMLTARCEPHVSHAGAAVASSSTWSCR